MSDRKTENRMSRRGFIRSAGSGVGAVGLASVALANPTPAQTAQTPPKRNSAGYRETEHVRRAYALSRF